MAFAYNSRYDFKFVKAMQVYKKLFIMMCKVLIM